MARLSKMYGETKVSSGAVASKEEGRRSHFQEAIVEENEVKAASKGKLADQLEKVKAFFKKLFRRKEEKKAEPTVVISAYSKGKVKAKAVVTSEAPPVDEFGVPMI